ncbi:MAG: Glu-tRNA(Gln) amidotransferase subunit GatD [Nitrososphaerota archaeon]|nr:Glu-tRNA(Gln) amidotransferase subunit GatD [Nitrososphaerota archaeon]
MADKGGYSGPSLQLIEGAGVSVGDLVELDLGGEKVTGSVVPRYQYDDDSHIVVKLKSGYNVGIRISRVKSIKRIATGEKPAFASTPPRPRQDLPEVAILGTGGTIASRVDYRTGAVHPAISSEDLYSLMPELSDIARIKPEIVLTVYSENLEPADWQKIADKAVEAIEKGARGVVVTTGTDTMGYTAAALSFALQGVPVPVIVVGSQRSSDRPSSDAYLNLIGAVSIAVSADVSGVYVAMHSDMSDDRVSVHRASRVRKNHTSSRDAFQSVGVDPIAFWTRNGLESLSKDVPKRRTGSFASKTRFESAVGLVKFYPSMSTSFVESALTGLRGVVIEGSGLGHINRKNISVVQEFVKRGGVACMTSQCIWGRVDMDVYDTGRDLLQAGVIPLEDMLAETALVKLMWALANSGSPDDARRTMTADLVGETTKRTLSSRST